MGVREHLWKAHNDTPLRGCEECWGSQHDFLHATGDDDHAREDVSTQLRPHEAVALTKAIDAGLACM